MNRGPARTVKSLFREGAHTHLSEPTRRAILALGWAAIEPLLALVEDERLTDSDDDALWYVQAHAVKLLFELHAVEAVERLVHVHVTRNLQCEPSEFSHSLLEYLPQFGVHAVDPALAAYRRATHRNARGRLAFVLAECGVKDERIFELLLERLEDDHVSTPPNLAAYGDLRALPPLIALLDRYIAEPTWTRYSTAVLLDLTDAIEALGGTLTLAQQRAVPLAEKWRERDELQSLDQN